MQDCWYEEPSNRPTFSDLTTQFEQLLQEYQLLSEYQDNGEYLDLSKIANANKNDEKTPELEDENDEFIKQTSNQSETHRPERNPPSYSQSESRNSFPTQTNV